MKVKKIKLQNYTIFENQEIEFSPGINIIIGGNGTGKTQLMKALYAACQSTDQRNSFFYFGICQRLVSIYLILVLL